MSFVLFADDWSCHRRRQVQGIKAKHFLFHRNEAELFIKCSCRFTVRNFYNNRVRVIITFRSLLFCRPKLLVFL